MKTRDQDTTPKNRTETDKPTDESRRTTDESRENTRMRDVSHTPSDGDGADRVWDGTRVYDRDQTDDE